MTLAQLRCLQAIVDTGSFKAASERLFKSQPAISTSIRKLEEEFGFLLFSRDKYRPVLTHNGQAFYQEALKVLSQSQQLHRIGEQLGQGTEAQLQVSVHFICPLPVITGPLKLCEQKYPNTQMNLTIAIADNALMQLEADKADIILVPSIAPPSPLFESKKLAMVQMHTVAAPDYWLAQKKRKVGIDELQQAIQVVISQQPKPHQGKQYGVVEGGRHWYVNDYTSKKQVLEAGLGWGNLPDHLVKHSIEAGTLQVLECELPRVTLDVIALRRRDRVIGPVAKYLWTQLIER